MCFFKERMPNMKNKLLIVALLAVTLPAFAAKTAVVDRSFTLKKCFRRTTGLVQGIG